MMTSFVLSHGLSQELASDHSLKTVHKHFLVRNPADNPVLVHSNFVLLFLDVCTDFELHLCSRPSVREFDGDV